MFWKKKKPAWKLQLGVDVKRCAECDKHERPCLADEKPATFHRFIEENRALFRINCFVPERADRALVRRFNEEGVIPPGCSTEILRETLALVEYPDGSLGRVDPVKVCFTDKGH